MGVPPVKKARKGVDLTLPNGNSLKFNELDSEASTPKLDSEASTPKEEIQNGGGCCQGANGFSCCRDETPEPEKEVNKVINFLTREWENYEVFAVGAIVGAVVPIAFLEGQDEVCSHLLLLEMQIYDH